MRIISVSNLKSFWERKGCETSRIPIRAWLELMSKDYTSFNAIRADFPSADIVGNSRMVFNLGGNKYRLIAAFNFEYGLVYIKFIGTHSEYDKIADVTSINQFPPASSPT